MSSAALSSICIGSADHELHAAFFDYVRKTFGHNADFLAWRLCRSAEPVTRRFGARAYDSILFWHALSYFAADVFYLPDQDAVIVARTGEETLSLFDVLSAQPFDLAAMLPGIADTPTRRLEFEFAPERWWPSAVPIRRYTGDQLFVRGSRSMPAAPFKFPSLAHT